MTKVKEAYSNSSLEDFHNDVEKYKGMTEEFETIPARATVRTTSMMLLVAAVGTPLVILTLFWETLLFSEKRNFPESLGWNRRSIGATLSVLLALRRLSGTKYNMHVRLLHPFIRAAHLLKLRIAVRSTSWACFCESVCGLKTSSM